MALRWYINPVIETLDEGTLYRRAKIATMLDPTRTEREYEHSSIIQEEINWCLTKVLATDFSVIDADPTCISLLEQSFEEEDGFIETTFRDLGWSATKRDRVRARLEAKGVDTSGYTLDTPLWRVVLDLARTIWPDLTREKIKEGIRIKKGLI